MSDQYHDRGFERTSVRRRSGTRIGSPCSDHPAVGLITLDCDTLLVALDDLRISVYTAEPGTEDAARLDLAIVLGTQSLTP
ncbi:MmyB family transcriptional regulator [Nocardia kruczakiae]|uniref:MmyB family transcriptional regulator n=1 Tax=Nocardia kruczakiae TaxID=261477 RepID=UPI0007A505F3|nr:hypothetical protein [Nocardia kruczakiae]